WNVEKERIPPREDLRLILSYANQKQKSMILTALSSGVRVSTLLALKLKNIKVYMEDESIISLLDFIKSRREVKNEIGIIVVTAEITKKRQEYVTFITSECLKNIILYLKERETKGEKLEPESLLFPSTKTRRKISINAIEMMWMRLLRKAERNFKGRKWHLYRWHTLRKYFKSWCTLSGAQSEVVEAWMGHKSGIHQIYFLSGIEDLENPLLIKRLIEEYRKCIPALTIMEVSEEKLKKLEEKLEEEKQKRIEQEKLIQSLEKQIENLTKRLKELENKAKTLKYIW
ncbi:MAG: tyrosine-type recombinase/integrase, partial [Candidatus Njordarchaeales archaeon]